MSDSTINLERRWRIRLFVAVILTVFAHETIPLGPDHLLSPDPLTRLLYRIGLWQRPWSMFSPNPHKMSTWVSAELVDKNNQSSTWSSPQWEYVGPTEKFYRFRYFNYYNCFENPLDPLVVDDLAAHLQRTLPTAQATMLAEDVREVMLSLNTTKLLLPQDGTLPPREETYRMYSNQPLGIYTYSP